MIVSNSADEAVKEKASKEVQFLMMLTDDTTQDEHNVLKLKSIVIISLSMFQRSSLEQMVQDVFKVPTIELCNHIGKIG
jgi:hypothetical protein